MERESFENPKIGHLLNEHFVSIKVDREERPDVDKVYMTFVQVNLFYLSSLFDVSAFHLNFCFSFFKIVSNMHFQKENVLLCLNTRMEFKETEAHTL